MLARISQACVSSVQHTATHCNTLQHSAAHCKTLQHTAAHCNTLQHTATHCNILQHTAAHWEKSSNHLIHAHTCPSRIYECIYYEVAMIRSPNILLYTLPSIGIYPLLRGNDSCIHTRHHTFYGQIHQCMCNKWQRFVRIPTVPLYVWPNISIQLSWSGKPFVAQMFQRIYDSMSQSIQVSWSGNSSYVHTRHQTILSQMYQCICYGVAIKLKTKYINVSIAKYMNMSTVQLQRFIPSHMIPHYFWPNTSMCLLWSGKRFVVQILEVKILERIHDSKYEYMCCGVATIRMFTHGTMLILAKCTNVSIMEQQTMRSPNI